MSVRSPLLLYKFGSNLNGRFQGLSLVGDNCHNDIRLGIMKSVKSQPKNTLKDFKAFGKTKGLVHRSLASKRKKKLQSKTPPSDLNIISHNIRGLASRKVSLEDILEPNKT